MNFVISLDNTATVNDAQLLLWPKYVAIEGFFSVVAC